MTDTVETPAPQPQTRAERIRAWRETRHLRPRFRAEIPARQGRGLIERTLFVFWPWQERQYPGIGRLRAWLMDCPQETARQYRGSKLPRVRALIAAQRIEELCRRGLAMAAELRAYANPAGADQASAPLTGPVPPPE